MLTIESTYQIVILLFSIGMLISSMEFLASTKIFATDGLNSWDILQLRWPSLTDSKLFNKIFSQTGMKSLLLVRIVLILSLQFLPFQSMIWTAVTFALVISYLLTNINTNYGSDGSDQMNNIILIVLLLCTVPFADSFLLKLGIIFIAAQSCFSYLSAGVSKLFSKAWRNGSAVGDIFKTRTYGSESIAKYLKGKKFLGLFLCWSVIIIETLFPLVLLLPLEWGAGILLWGLSFHVLNAVIMGLNSFLWAFLATYPAIIYVNFLIKDWLAWY